MDLSTNTSLIPSELKLPDGADIDEWNFAYEKVEAYLRGLRVRNKLLIAKLNFQILKQAADRLGKDTHLRPTEAAIEEAIALVNDWCGKVVGDELESAPGRVSTRNRLSLLLVDMPNRYQKLFLTEGPWPEHFVEEMKASLLRSGPDFQISQMTPREIDLGPVRKLEELKHNSPVWRLIPGFLLISFLITLAVIIYKG